MTLTLDAARDLPGLLASIPEDWPIVVADGGSRDETRRVARAFGARVIDQDLAKIARARGNFDVARNHAAGSVATPWILFLDADERLTPALVSEIERSVLGRPAEFAAFSIPRQNLFWGRPCRLLGEDRQIRLVEKGAGSYVGTELHRPMRVRGAVGELEEPMVHLNVRSWRDVVRRMARYVPQRAGVERERPGLLEIVSEPWFLFRYYYIENEARRDGLRGLVMSSLYALERGLVLMLSWARRRAHA